MKIVLIAILAATAIATGVYVGMTAWSDRQAAERAVIIAECKKWADIRALSDQLNRTRSTYVDPECVGVYP